MQHYFIIIRSAVNFHWLCCLAEAAYCVCPSLVRCLDYVRQWWHLSSRQRAIWSKIVILLSYLFAIYYYVRHTPSDPKAKFISNAFPVSLIAMFMQFYYHFELAWKPSYCFKSVRLFGKCFKPCTICVPRFFEN